MYQKRDNIEYGIILLLIREKIHLRGIAKKLGQPHSTIARNLEFLKKSNIIDSKVEGRNRVFFLKKNIKSMNYVYNAERAKLTMLIEKYPELDVTLEDIMKYHKETLIILFGSYAKFSAKKDSDIDIYVETKNRNVKNAMESMNSKISVKIGLFDMKSNMIKEIIKNHVIIRGVEDFYERTGFFD